ncbi:ATP-binding protein [Marinibaculum pumilum]|uniref:histidine kinase n=1 Tax=Marinibaculum pumilum TaxID=1766165 RepID=A0ABV7L634_9PROT
MKNLIDTGKADFWATGPLETVSSLLDAIGIAVFVIAVRDDGYVVEFINSAYERVFSTRNEQIAGRRLDDILPPRHAQQVAENYRRCIAAGSIVEYDEDIELPGGLFYARTTLTPLRDGARTVRLIGSSMDFTDRRKLEFDLETARDRAEVANRAKTEFMANMSHELRTPLNAVIGYAEMLEAEMFGALGSPKYREYSGDIAFAGRHLLEIINDILDLARIESGATPLDEAPVVPAEIVEDAARLSQARAETVAAEMLPNRLPDGIRLRADRRLLRQALVNLVANARKFSADITAVQVGSDLLADGRLCFYVSDTGRGIAARDLPTALAPFGRIESADKAGPAGAGLGLPITRTIAERHGGELFINSEPGVGTTVYLVLPTDRVEAPEGTRPQPSIAGLKDFFALDGVALADSVPAMSERGLDELPVGTVLLDGSGKVLRYNAVEAGFAELRAERVKGRNFFREIAPCTFTDTFHGRFRDVSEGRSRSEIFSYVFTLRRPWKVLIEMRPGPEAGTVWLFIRWV